MPEARLPDLTSFTEIDHNAVNAIRFLATDAVQKAESGHPGMPMGAAAMAYVLWTRHLRHDPADPEWLDRDRFILSAGHGSMLLYALLHLSGYDLPMEEITNFRQWGSRTPGHPENHVTPGVEVTTGPLGQGVANGVGKALAERYLGARFNQPDVSLIDHYTFAIVSDGDLMEGIASEAASFAGHQGLGKLIYLYDDNEISIDGDTDITFTEDVGKRFESFGWQVIDVEDGNDLEAVDAAIKEAKRDTQRPSLLRVRTHIGYGSPNKQDTAAAHGAPLGPEEVTRSKEALGWPTDTPFYVPEEVYNHFRQTVATGVAAHDAWSARKTRYTEAYPEKAAELDRWLTGTLPEDWDAELPDFQGADPIATRKASGKTLDAIVPKLNGYLMGGSADLTGSNKTHVDGQEDQQQDHPQGEYIRFGVREHAMAGIANGMTLHGGVRPYVATFLIFSDYLRPSLRLSALSEAPVTYVFTHDSIGLGEDGPTHQPIEHLQSLRAIPNHTVIRPADGAETVQAWKAALQNSHGPTSLVLTRQTLPNFDRTALADADGLHQGAYILDDDTADGGQPDVILIGTGSEVQHAVEAARRLRQHHGIAVRVVSMPSWELFEAQSDEYRASVLPSEVTARVAIEAGARHGWERYVGMEGTIIGIDRFGASAPGSINMEKFGFTPENVVAHVEMLLNGDSAA